MNKDELSNVLLNFYKSDENVILIDGKWGSGKTYLINEFIHNFNNPNHEHNHINLFNVFGVDDSIIEGMHNHGEESEHIHDDHDHRHDAVGEFSDLIRLLHGDALGHKLAEDKRKIRKDYRNYDDRNGIQRSGRQRVEAESVIYPIHKPVGKAVGRKSASQKAGKRYAYLDG